jgi:protein translocase SecG subunit
MNILHVILQVLQFILAIALIGVVMSQTSKDQGLGGTLGGGDGGGGGSRYTGGYEEKMDNLAKNLVISFLVLSFIVALVGHYV